MKYSEALKWIDAMHESVCTTQAIVINGFRQREGIEVVTERQLELIKSTGGWLFTILPALEKLQNIIRDGGNITPMNMFNLFLLFNRNAELGIGLLSMLPKLTFKGKEVKDIPVLDAQWL